MDNTFNEIIKSESISLVSDLSEISLDKFITNETLKDIPFLGSINKLLNIGNTINDRIFTKKLIHFLNELKDLDKDFILKEIQFLDDSKEYNYKVGEKLLEIISRIDSDEKPQIIGKLFKNYLLKKINYNQFLKFCYLIETIFIADLQTVKDSKISQIYRNVNKTELMDVYQLSVKIVSQELYSYGIVESSEALSPF